MNTVVLIKASIQKEVVKTTEAIEGILRARNYRVLHLYGSYDFPFDPVLPAEKIDLAFAIGGDGTALKAARICAKRSIPILPVKVGEFGFINDIQFDEWTSEFDNYLEGRGNVSELPLLELTIADSKFYALNDITICAAGYGAMRATVHIGKEFLSRYRADGLLISTAIGSTAHSLSIGGPILVPGSRSMIFTPIAPFTLSNRPLILPLDSVTRITLDQVQRTHSLLVIDGKVILSLLPEASVTVTMSEYTANIIQSCKRSYFEVLRSKLGWAGEFRA